MMRRLLLEWRPAALEARCYHALAALPEPGAPRSVARQQQRVLLILRQRQQQREQQPQLQLGSRLAHHLRTRSAEPLLPAMAGAGQTRHQALAVHQECGVHHAPRAVLEAYCADHEQRCEEQGARAQARPRRNVEQTPTWAARCVETLEYLRRWQICELARCAARAVADAAQQADDSAA